MTAEDSGPFPRERARHAAAQPDVGSHRGGRRADIHAGRLAAERGIGQVDGDETFTIEHVTGNAANETISVEFAGQSQMFAGIRQIIAHAGAGQDTIQLRPGVLSSASSWAARGDDVLGGGDAGDMLSGGRARISS